MRPFNSLTCATVLVSALGLSGALPGQLSAQQAPGPLGPEAARAPTLPDLLAHPAGPAAHETSAGVFIDPLITEHAFVDRKVRSDLAARFLREEDAGRVYVNEYTFEYAFTRWFSLEIAQPIVFTDPDLGESGQGPGDISLGAKFQLTRAAETGGVIVSAGLAASLPSGEAEVGAGDEYVVAPLAGFDWAIDSEHWRLQSLAEAEIAIPRAAGESEFEAIEWNSALSYFVTERVVPLIEVNTEFEGLEEDTREIFAITPGVVISLKDIAGKSFDLAAGAQVFFGNDREEDVALLLSVRHHWPFGIVAAPPALN